MAGAAASAVGALLIPTSAISAASTAAGAAASSVTSPSTGDGSGDAIVGGRNSAGGADVLRGGSGNDAITVNDLTFAQVDGGLGTDTLNLNGTGLSLDLTSVDHGVDGVEIINLTGTGDNTLTLSGAAISQHGGSNTLRVDGNAGDTATLSDYINWTNTGTTDIGAVTYDVYTQGALTLQVAGAVGGRIYVVGPGLLGELRAHHTRRETAQRSYSCAPKSK